MTTPAETKESLRQYDFPPPPAVESGAGCPKCEWCDAAYRCRVADGVMEFDCGTRVSEIGVFRSAGCKLTELTRTLATVTKERDLLNHSLDSVREISIIKLPEPLGYIYRRSSGDWCHPDTSITAMFPTALAAIRAAIATEPKGGGS